MTCDDAYNLHPTLIVQRIRKRVLLTAKR